MIPGPMIIRACPQCDQQIRQTTLTSGNNIGARYWTDGKCDAPMLPDQPWLVKCPSCHKLFWIDEAKEHGEVDPFEYDDKKLSKLIDYEIPTEEDYLKYVSKGNLPEEKERYIRVKAWWIANDSLREVKKPEESNSHFSVQQKDNLVALSNMLNDNSIEDRLMKAEIAREIAMFEEALVLLDYTFPEEYKSAVDTMISLCNQRNISVIEVK